MDELKSSGKSFDISKREVWEALSTVAARAGGPVRISDEAPVMGVERRGRLICGLFTRATRVSLGGDE